MLPSFDLPSLQLTMDTISPSPSSSGLSTLSYLEDSLIALTMSDEFLSEDELNANESSLSVNNTLQVIFAE